MNRLGGVSLLFLEEMIPEFPGQTASSQRAGFQEDVLGDPVLGIPCLSSWL